jgi:hypothetical protein
VNKNIDLNAAQVLRYSAQIVFNAKQVVVPNSLLCVDLGQGLLLTLLKLALAVLVSVFKQTLCFHNQRVVALATCARFGVTCY